MKPFDLIAALALPDSALIDRRVPKTLLIENATPTAADKRYIREGIEEIGWVAALKPTTIGVAEYRDAASEYLEIAVLKLTLRSGARSERLTELVHRAVPYPVLLATCHGEATELSLAHKRWSRGEAGKTVLDGGLVTVALGNRCSDKLTATFCNALALSRQPLTSLHALYQGWINTVQALCAARVTGVFSIPTSVVEAEDRAHVLREYRRLESRITELTIAANKEKQLARRVDMNLELARLRTDRKAARTRL